MSQTIKQLQVIKKSTQKEVLNCDLVVSDKATHAEQMETANELIVEGLGLNPHEIDEYSILIYE